MKLDNLKEALPSDAKKVCLRDYKENYISAWYSIKEDMLFIIFQNKEGIDIANYINWGEKDGNTAYGSSSDFFATRDFLEFYYYGENDPLDY